MTTSRAVVIGASAGAVEALLALLPSLPVDFPVPVLVVVHVPPVGTSVLTGLFRARCRLAVKEAEDKEPLQAGVIYFAPPDYHLLVETNGDIALSSDEAVNFSRPSIDVLFESAADVFGAGLTGIILTGANHDGARGLKAVADAGGVTLVEAPDEAYARAMPEAALEGCAAAIALTLEQIALRLKELARA